METRSNARDWQTRIRLGAALVIGSFQVLYLSYYAAGLVSGEAMEAVLDILSPVLVLTPLYTAALVTHMGLGLYKFYRRNTLKMPAWEAAQILLGLCLPFLLVPSNLAFFYTGVVFAIPLNYVDTLLLSYPDLAWRSILTLLVVGAHAQIGTHAVLRLRPWYPQFRVTLAAVLTLLPLAAALGYVLGTGQFAKELVEGVLPPEDQPHALTSDQVLFLRQADLVLVASFLGLYAVLFLARFLRLRAHRKNRTVRIDYPSGHSVLIHPATTVLEASRIGSIPHASICGGRGRCTTCRIKVESGMENLSAVGDRERKALLRIGAGPDIRLACQAEGRTGEVRVTPLLPPDLKSAVARRETRDSVGRDVELAVMFADLRGFTALSEQKFPYDVVYILNSYFQAMGRVIEAHHGTVDKFLGDGILAYFGLDRDPRQACLDAVNAARDMALELRQVNLKLAAVLPQGLSLGIGIHYGDVVLGEVGFQEKRQLTIIGGTVNIASRLEALNKQTGSQLLMTTGVAAQAGLDLSALPVITVNPRGMSEPLRVYVVKDIVADLTAQ